MVFCLQKTLLRVKVQTVISKPGGLNMGNFSVKCRNCSKSFALWRCPECGGDNAPEAFLKTINVESRMATIREILERLVERSQFLVGNFYFSALSIGVPSSDHPWMMPFPYVDEILATICGLGFITREPSKNDHGWMCYGTSESQIESIRSKISTLG